MGIYGFLDLLIYIQFHVELYRPLKRQEICKLKCDNKSKLKIDKKVKVASSCLNKNAVDLIFRKTASELLMME